MKKKLLASILTVCMLFTMLPTAVFAAETEAEPSMEQTAPILEDAVAQPEGDGDNVGEPATDGGGETATVSSREELETALNNSSVSTINIDSNIDMGTEYWTPAEIGRELTINGQNHKILNMKVNAGVLKPSGSGIAGDGGSCDYYAGFIGNNKTNTNLTIQNLTFSGAMVDIDPLTINAKSTGSSILAVVVANNNGELVYNNVNVEDSTVRGYSKVGLLHGFTQKGGSFVANKCSVENSYVVLEADGSDKEAALSGILIGYDGNNAARTNGIKMSGCEITIDSSVKWNAEIQTKLDGTRYVGSWGLTSPTYADDGYGMNSVAFVAEVGGYQYETLADAIAAAKDGETVTLLNDVTLSGGYTDQQTGLEIRSSVTIDGQDQYTISAGSFNRGIRIYGGGTKESGIQVIFRGVTITNDLAGGRCIDTRGGYIDLTLDHATLCTTGTGNTQPLTIGGNHSELTPVTIKNGSKIIAGNAGYPIIAFNPIKAEITGGSELSGYCGIYFKNANGSAGSHDSVVNAVDSRFDCPNVHTEESDSSFAVFPVDDENITISLTNCYVNAKRENTAEQTVFSPLPALKAYTFRVDGDRSEVIGDIFDGAYQETETKKCTITGGTFSVDPNAYCATGYAAAQNESGQWVVGPKEGMEADTSISGNTVSAEVGGTFSGTEDLEQDNVGASNGTLSIDATVTGGDTAVTKTEVSIGNEALTSVSGAASVNSVALKTNVADLTVDKAAWNAITNNASGARVELVIEEKAGTDSAPLTYTVTAKANGKDVYGEDNAAGSIKISVAYAGAVEPKVYYVGPNGLEDMKAELKDGILSWTAKHFSDYVVISGEKKILVKESDGSLEYYGTLADAITNADKNAVITLLGDIPNAVGIAVPSGKEFVLDFNQHTYTLVGPGQGSSGTETNAFQLLKDSTITFKNGTIRIAEGANNIKRIIQNYANLTLDNMQIYTANQVGGEDYALSFNNGNIVFKGNTSVVTSNDNVVAFDVCKFSSYPGVTVTFDETYTGTINGKIVYDSPNADTHQLIVKPNQGILGAIESSTTPGASDAAKNGGIAVSGGSFTAPVAPEYLADGLNFEAKDSNGIYTYHTKIDDALDAAGSSGTVSSTEENPELEIILPTPTKEGYTFLYWQAEDGMHYKGGEKVKASVFHALTAVWEKNSDQPSGGSSDNERTYAIVTEDDGHGSVTVSADKASAGTRITVTVKPDSGYKLDELTVTDAKNKELAVTKRSESTYTFHMADSKVTVEASFSKDGTVQKPDTRFDDVAKSAWYYKAVEYVAGNGIMSGVSAREFAPNAGFSRAMLAQTLYAMSGKPAVKAEGTFADVAANAWYADAVNWAAEKGYVSGVGDGKFAPDASVTREQMALILYRYAGSPDASGMAQKEFADSSSVSAYAADAIRWAVHEGLISGMENNTLAPQGTATRAQVAQILMNFHQKLDK